MKYLIPWIKQLSDYKGKIALGTVMIALTVLSAIALLGLSGYFITETGLAGIIIAAGGAIYINIYTPAGGIRAFALTRTVSRYIERVYNHDTVLSLLSKLRIYLFSNLSQLPWRQQTGQRYGQWLNRLTHDVSTLDNLYLRLLAPPIVALVSSLIVVAITAIWLPNAAIILIFGFALLFFLTTYLPATLGRSLGLSIGSEYEALRYQVLDHLNGVLELKAAHVQSKHIENVWLHQERIEIQQRRLAKVFSVCQTLSQQWLLIVVVFQLLVGIQGFLSNTISGPILVMLMLATLGLNEAFINLSKSFTDYGLTLLSAKRLFALVSNKQVPIASETVTKPINGSVIECQSLSFEQGTEPILDNINFQLQDKSTALITGPSGSGKSTLAKLIVGLHQATKGSVFIYGKAPRAWPPEDGLQDCYWLSQDNHIFSDTLANNLRLSNPNADDECLWKALDDVCLSKRIEQTRLGLNTWIGEAGLPLSGGEIQRLVIARALLAEQNIVLMDEPFKGIDKVTAKTILLNIEDWMNGKIIVWFAHEHSVLPNQFNMRLSLETE